MKQLNIIPNPNKIDYLGGSVKMENIDSESFSARLTDKLPEEGYVLEVTENGVEATAAAGAGLLCEPDIEAAKAARYLPVRENRGRARV